MYNTEYQKRVMSPLINEIDNSIKYDVEKGINIDDYKNLGTINNFIIFESNNYIEKQLENAIIQMAQVNTDEIEYDYDIKRRKPLFSGIFIKITYNIPNSKINISEIEEICNSNQFKFKISEDSKNIYLINNCGNIFKEIRKESALDKEIIYNRYLILKNIIEKSTMITKKFI